MRSWQYVKLSKYHRCVGRPPAGIVHPKQRGDPAEMGLGRHHTRWIIRLNLMSPRETSDLHQLTADSQGSYRVSELAAAPPAGRMVIQGCERIWDPDFSATDVQCGLWQSILVWGASALPSVKWDNWA